MKLLYATTNEYKLRAANASLKDFAITLEKLPVGAPDIPEIQSSQQAAVALDKALKYYELYKRPLIVMDFGFFVEGLNGFPGVYTKYAIETIGNEGLKQLVRPLGDRTAYTERTVVYIDKQEHKAFSSRCPGTFVLDERGSNGHDFDFLFQVDATGKTLAEMTDEERAAVSGGAWQAFGSWLSGKSFDLRSDTHIKN